MYRSDLFYSHTWMCVIMSLCLFSGLQMCLEHVQLSLCLAWHQWFISCCWQWQTVLLCFSCTNYLLFSCMDCQVKHAPTNTHIHTHTCNSDTLCTQVHECICICVCIGAQMVVADLSENEKRAEALGKLGLCFGIGMIAGSTLGGTLSTRFG